MKRTAAVAVITLLLCFTTFAQKDTVSTREMERINWMEFKEQVPGKIKTVLLPTGTLEPHGVINNGADITAPLAMARTIAPRTNAMIAPALHTELRVRWRITPALFRSPKARIAPSSNRSSKAWRKTVSKTSSSSTATGARKPPC